MKSLFFACFMLALRYGIDAFGCYDRQEVYVLYQAPFSGWYRLQENELVRNVSDSVFKLTREATRWVLSYKQNGNEQVVFKTIDIHDGQDDLSIQMNSRNNFEQHSHFNDITSRNEKAEIVPDFTTEMNRLFWFVRRRRRRRSTLATPYHAHGFNYRQLHSQHESAEPDHQQAGNVKSATDKNFENSLTWLLYHDFSAPVTLNDEVDGSNITIYCPERCQLEKFEIRGLQNCGGKFQREASEETEEHRQKTLRKEDSTSAYDASYDEYMHTFRDGGGDRNPLPEFADALYNGRFYGQENYEYDYSDYYTHPILNDSMLELKHSLQSLLGISQNVRNEQEQFFPKVEATGTDQTWRPEVYMSENGCTIILHNDFQAWIISNSEGYIEAVSEASAPCLELLPHPRTWMVFKATSDSHGFEYCGSNYQLRPSTDQIDIIT